MKNGRFILPEKLQGKQGRTLLAVGIGLLAMVLILLSELFRPGRQRLLRAKNWTRQRIRRSWSSGWKRSSPR